MIGNMQAPCLPFTFERYRHDAIESEIIERIAVDLWQITNGRQVTSPDREVTYLRISTDIVGALRTLLSGGREDTETQNVRVTLLNDAAVHAVRSRQIRQLKAPDAFPDFGDMAQAF